MSFSGTCWLLGKAVSQAPSRLRQLSFGFRQMKKFPGRLAGHSHFLYSVPVK